MPQESKRNEQQSLQFYLLMIREALCKAVGVLSSQLIEFYDYNNPTKEEDVAWIYKKVIYKIIWKMPV